MPATSDQKTRVLLIDDDPFILDMYVLKLKERGFAVDIASDGKTGLQKLQTFQPDVVLLDIVLPSMDGFSVLETIKKQTVARPPKVVLLTNLGQKEDIDRGMRLGADDYLIKAHFTPSEVVNKIERLVNKP